MNKESEESREQKFRAVREGAFTKEGEVPKVGGRHEFQSKGVQHVFQGKEDVLLI